MIKTETHLFIIWEKARNHEQEIIAKIRQKFSVLKLFEVSWNRDKFSENLTSFYGAKLPKNSHKEEHCGNGKFLLIVVEDQNPQYAERPTSKGVQVVNINLFDAKDEYRQITGGGHKIHSTNSLKEVQHDIVLLTGLSLKDFRKKYQTPSQEVEELKIDLPAVRGWKSVEELFYFLNETSEHVVLRNFDILPKSFSSEEHGDIDLLVDDLNEIMFVTGATKIFDLDYRVHCKIKIVSEEVLFDFRYLNDGYYDSKIEKEILQTRKLNEQNIFTPSSEMHFYSLLYHALVHKHKIANDYLISFSKLSDAVGVIDYSKNFRELKEEYLKKLLDEWMVKNGYSYTKPNDKSVIFNEENILSKNLIIKPRVFLNERFVSLSLRLNKLNLYLLQGVLPNIFRIKIRLGGLFKIDISLGKLKDL